MRYLLSIIVPIYNVVGFLERCLDSIPLFSGRIELILVDDGSDDGSGSLADLFAKGKENVHVYHKPNGGLSSARNYGLKYSSGKYVFFVDSDDYLNGHELNSLLDALENINDDVVAFNTCRIWDSFANKYSFFGFEGTISGLDFLKEQLIHQSFKVAVWNYIFSKRFLDRVSVPFKEGIVQEDTLWTPLVLSSAKTVLFKDVVVYNYCIRSNSISTRKDLSKNMVDLISTINILLDHFKDSDALFYRLLKDYLVNNYLSVFAQDRFYKKGKEFTLKYSFLRKDVYFQKTKAKLFLYGLNKRFYYLLSNAAKKGQ